MTETFREHTKKETNDILIFDNNKGTLRNVITSGETLCRDNCQLIGMPFFHTRSAGKNNRN